MAKISIEKAHTIFEAMFEKWNRSLSESYALISANPNTHGKELLEATAPTAKCYSKNAILWPTMGDGPCRTPEEIKEYFAHFAAKNPSGRVDGTPIINEDDIDYDAAGNPKITVHGKYIFTMDDPKSGKRVEVSCRFGYKIVREGNEWKWSHHNSDVLPSSQKEVKMTPIAERNGQTMAGRPHAHHGL